MPVSAPSDPVTAPSLHPEVAQLLRSGIYPKDVPKELKDHIYDIIELGPYVRYRWRESKHMYTISLGLLDDYGIVNLFGGTKCKAMMRRGKKREIKEWLRKKDAYIACLILVTSFHVWKRPCKVARYSPAFKRCLRG
jgi:hypothetical protein